jgi:hypothetical protein
MLQQDADEVEYRGPSTRNGEGRTLTFPKPSACAPTPQDCSHTSPVSPLAFLLCRTGLDRLFALLTRPTASLKCIGDGIREDLRNPSLQLALTFA